VFARSSVIACLLVSAGAANIAATDAKVASTFGIDTGPFLEAATDKPFAAAIPTVLLRFVVIVLF
jgi:hypothetical protein